MQSARDAVSVTVAPQSHAACTPLAQANLTTTTATPRVSLRLASMRDTRYRRFGRSSSTGVPVGCL